MTASTKRTIGDVIRDARIAIRFTQIDFAAELGVSRRTLSRWEMDATTPASREILWLVSKLHSFDREVSRGVARELGVQPAKGPPPEALEAAVVAAAASLNVPHARLRSALATIVKSWRETGATLDDAAASLEHRSG